jgi:hypothetical protein
MGDRGRRNWNTQAAPRDSETLLPTTVLESCSQRFDIDDGRVAQPRATPGERDVVLAGPTA